jgi:hypothetical protein
MGSLLPNSVVNIENPKKSTPPLSDNSVESDTIKYTIIDVYKIS